MTSEGDIGRTHTIRAHQLFSCKKRREKPQRELKMNMTSEVVN